MSGVVSIPGNEESPRATVSSLHTFNLMKKFDTRLVVEDVSFYVKTGEIVGLLGPNGAGKTTSFYMTVGLLRPTSGRVELDGVDISQLPIHKRARKGIGYLPQNASIFRKLTVEKTSLL